jgi:hypothetical protein
MDKGDIKAVAKRIWHFIWEEDSILSCIVNVILAFLVIKFIVYPGLGWEVHTSHPVVAVVSSSMEHEGTFDDWWDSNAQCGEVTCQQSDYYDSIGITRETFDEFPFRNGFNAGDIMVLYGTENIEQGDIIVFYAKQMPGSIVKVSPEAAIQYRSEPIIHRVIEISDSSLKTKGDHNPVSYKFESDIKEDEIIGKALFRIPFLGYIKIGFVKLLQLLHLA